MKQLQNYFYLQDASGILGWARTVEDGMDILTRKYVLSPEQDGAARMTMDWALKYFKTPKEDGERMSVFARGDGQPIALKGGMSNQTGILAMLSPMLFKGLSARLATLYLDNEVYMVRFSDDQAMPSDSYLSLLEADVRGFLGDGKKIKRAYESRKVKNPPVPSHLIANINGYDIPLNELTVDDITESLNKLSLPHLTEGSIIVLEFIRTLQDIIPEGVMTICNTYIWQHKDTLSLQVGKIPTTYGKPGTYVRVGILYGDIVSGCPGKMLHFKSDDTSIMIMRVED